MTQNLNTTTRPSVRLAAFLLDFFMPCIFLLTPILIIYIFGSLEDIKEIILLPFFIGYLVLHFMLMSRRSQSIGKYLLNIQIYDTQTKKRMTFWRILLLRDFVGRTLVLGALPIVGILFQIPYGIIDSLFIFSKDRQTLHDRIAHSIVIDIPEEQKRKGWQI